MAPQSPLSEDVLRKELDDLLERCLAYKKRGDYVSAVMFVLVTMSIVAIPYYFFHVGGESFWMDLLKSFASWVGFAGACFMMMGFSLSSMENKAAEMFNKRFPEDGPERTLAMEIVHRKAMHSKALQDLYVKFGGRMTMAESDDEPADEKVGDALAQLGPKPASLDPAPVSIAAAQPGLSHIPLQPDERKPAG